MSIDCVWLAALDKRKSMIQDIRTQVKKYLQLPLNVFMSGDGSNHMLKYDRIDLPASPELFQYCPYGVGEGRKNHANAFLSHREMFKKILSEGYNNALVLEEDIYFIEDRWKKIYYQEEVQEFINAESMWDALYFGWHQEAYPGDSSELNDVEYDWLSAGIYNITRAVPMYRSICGLHAILLNKKMLTRLSMIESGPMDSYLNKNLDRFKLFFMSPQIIGALESFSVAEGRWQERKLLT